MGLAQTYKDFKRLQQIANVLFKQELGYFVNKLKLKPHLPFKKRLQANKFLKPKDSVPRRLRLAMEELSGAFVKLGQLLSLRPDLIPQEYVEEFCKLQDSVKPFPFEKVKQIIELEFGKPINQVFSKFNKKPIASASVGQVHEAFLKNGKRVAVKVQRPKISKVFETDIDLMYHIAHLLEKHMPEVKNFNPSGIVGEFEKYTKKEMDYMIEGKNIERYEKVVAHERHVIVPKVYWDYTTSKVLTMQFIDGVKISSIKDFKKLNVKGDFLSKTLVRIFVNGVLYHRFFHADPHPGNILITKDKNIALLDFGIAGFLSSALTEKIGHLYFGMVNADIETIADELLDIGSASEETDKEKFKEDVRLTWEDYYNAELNEVDMVGFFWTSMDLGRKYDLTFPVEYTLLVKSIITTEGVIKKIEPHFNFVKSGKPLFEKFAKERSSPEYVLKSAKKTLMDFKDLIVKFPVDAQKILDKMKKPQSKVIDINDKDLKEFTHEIEESSNRMVLGVILAALIVASSLLILAKTPPFMWGLPLYSIVGLIIAGILIIILVVSVLK